MEHNQSSQEVRQLSLVKGVERYVFRYKKGKEMGVIDQFARLAEDKKSTFDWYDATVLSMQLGRRLEMDIAEGSR